MSEPCQTPAAALPDCGEPCRDCEGRDRIYTAARALLVAAGEALDECGLDQPCTRWVEPAVASIASAGPCACDALVVVIRNRIGPLLTDAAESRPMPIRLDLVISHRAMIAVDVNGIPTTMPPPGNENGSDCDSLNALSLRFAREAEALDRLLEDRIRCRLDWCKALVTLSDSWTLDGLCRRYTRSVEIRL